VVIPMMAVAGGSVFSLAGPVDGIAGPRRSAGIWSRPVLVIMPPLAIWRRGRCGGDFRCDVAIAQITEIAG
jgi:hypothetical protein